MSWLWLIPAFIVGFYFGFVIFALLLSSSESITDDWPQEQEMERHNDYDRRRQ